ncbi:hypothetical protein D3C71_1326460 [compost metagenome]
MLEDGKLVPGIDGNDGLQHRRQVFSLAHHAPPFVEPRIFVPIEVIDQRIFFRRAATAGTGCVLDRSFGAGQHRIDGRIVDAGQIFGVVTVIPLPFRIVRDGAPDGTDRLGADLIDVRRLSQSSDTVGRVGPAGWLGGDPPAGSQYVTSDCQLMGRCANIPRGVMEDEVFEMDELAVDPERRTGVGELGALDPSLTHRRTGDALVQTRQSDTGIESRPYQ